MSITRTSFHCTRDGLTIRGAVYRRKDGNRLPIVILSHEFMTNRLFVARYAKMFAELGYAAFTYDFCGGCVVGSSGGRSEDMTVFTECRDLEAVMVYARSKPAAASLSKAIQDGAMIKEYVALVHGTPPENGDWTDLLFKDSRKNKVFVVKRERRGVKKARLTYRLLKAGEQSLVRVRLYTGRSHQIRVQFASRKHPLVGDGKYGSKCNRCTPALWAWRLTFPHPQTGEWRRYDQKPPEQFPWNLFDENKETEQN